MNQTPKPKTVLLVEDEAPFRQIYSDAFHNTTDYQIIEAEDGEQAIAMVEKHQPDAILLDLILPKMTGFDVLTKLKNDPIYRQIPVVVYTVIDEKDQIDRAIKLGANSFTLKGLTPASEVVERVKGFLQDEPSL